MIAWPWLRTARLLTVASQSSRSRQIRRHSDPLETVQRGARSLYGLSEALKGQKKPAQKTMAAFRRAWRGGAAEPLR